MMETKYFLYLDESGGFREHKCKVVMLTLSVYGIALRISH